MRKQLVILALFCSMGTTPLLASFDQFPADPRSVGMAGAMTAIPGDVFGIQYNPAVQASANNSEAALSYALPYGNTGMNTFSAGVIVRPSLPFDRNAAFTCNWKKYGTDNYRESTTIAGIAGSLTDTVRAGVSIAQGSIESAGNTGDSATGISAGLTAEMGPGLIIGLSSLNINAPSTSKSATPLPRTTSAGISFQLTPLTLLAASVESSQEQPTRLRAGGEFSVFKKMWLRTGMATNPSIFSGGAGYRSGLLQADIGISRHIDLGTAATFGIRALF